MPKSTKYSLVWAGGSLELATDPRGWQEDAVAFSRDENHGINVQNVVALSFSGAARDKIKEFYDTYGAYAKMSVSIDKRNNLWELNSWYQYRLDFKTYKETKSFVEISGIEEGLLSSVQKFADQEYTLYPIYWTDRKYLSYTGITKYKKNQVQARYGSIQGNQKSDLGSGNDWYVLGGDRAVRTYSTALSFTNNAGEPYETMTMRAISNTTFSLVVRLSLTVIANGTLRSPSAGRLYIVIHDSNFNYISYVANTAPTPTSVKASKRTDVFNWNTTQSVTLTAGQYLSVVYHGDEGLFDNVSVENAQNAYVEVGGNVESPYIDKKLEVFTFETIIVDLLKKIYPNVEFVSNLTYSNYYLMLSCTQSIYALGTNGGNFGVKSKLSDFLKTLNVFKMIGIDIQFDKFTIYPLQSLYSPTAAINTINAKDIVIEHDNTHQYKSVKVGATCDERGEDDDLVYPFIVEKQFQISDCEFDAELDLVSPFMVDPYDIERYIDKTLSDENTRDETKFVVFACKFIGGNFNITQVASWNASESGDQSIQDVVAIANTQNFTVQTEGSVSFKYSTTCLSNLSRTYSVRLYKNGSLFTAETAAGVAGVTTKTYNLDSGTWFIEVVQIAAQNPSGFPTVCTAKIEGVDTSDTISVTTDSAYLLYKDHVKPIANFTGDSNTIYNIPLTPKRILQSWDSYLKISVYGNPTGKLNFISSKFKNTSITSRCGFEASNVVENSDFTPISTTPIFQPKICTFTAAKKYEGDAVFIPKKYERYRVVDTKRGLTYTGWIKDFTFGLNKAKEQDYVLQIQSIT